MRVWFRSLMGWVGWVVITLTLGTLVGIVAVFSRKASFRVSRAWARLLMLVAGATIEVRGDENADASRPTIYASNHQSYTDVVSLIAEFPIDVLFVYKSTLLVFPGLNVAMLGQGHIKVPRGRPAKALRRLSTEAVAKLKEGKSVMIFPAGELSWDDSVGDFKNGAAALAIWAGAPIVSVAISGSRNVLPRGNWPLKPGKIIISIGQPIPTNGMTIKQRDDVISLLKQKVKELKDEADKEL